VHAEQRLAQVGRACSWPPLTWSPGEQVQRPLSFALSIPLPLPGQLFCRAAPRTAQAVGRSKIESIKGSADDSILGIGVESSGWRLHPPPPLGPGRTPRGCSRRELAWWACTVPSNAPYRLTSIPLSASQPTSLDPSSPTAPPSRLTTSWSPPSLFGVRLNSARSSSLGQPWVFLSSPAWREGGPRPCAGRSSSPEGEGRPAAGLVSVAVVGT